MASIPVQLQSPVKPNPMVLANSFLDLAERSFPFKKFWNFILAIYVICRGRGFSWKTDKHPSCSLCSGASGNG